MVRNGVKAFYAKDRKTWRKWLEKNHDNEKSIWLIIYHKQSKVPSVYYNDAVEEALCFGWIDSKPNKRDKESFYLYFSKRSTRSKWSKINKVRVKNLTEAGLMTEAGLQMVQFAKRNKTWNALNKTDKLTIPVDLAKEFKANKVAFQNFTLFPASARKAILEWIDNAKRDETRQRRIEETIVWATKNIRANAYPRKKE